MNDQADFTPQVRNSAIWSGDSRKVANGKMVDVILEKQGKKPLPDLSDIEAVQMGHIMQPTIGKLAQQRLGIELKDADYALAHPTNEWFRSHFDFVSADGNVLVEAKNYNAAVRSKFDPESNRITPNWFTKLLVIMLAVSFWQCYLVDKSFTPLNLISLMLKRMISYKRWQRFGVMSKREQHPQQKQSNKPRSSTQRVTMESLRLISRLRWLSLTLKILRIRLRILRLMRKI